MREFALICLAMYTLAAAIVSVVLLLRWRRTRALPELLIGLTYLTSPALGYPLVVIAGLIGPGTGSLVAFIAGEIGIVFGFSCFILFNARVFRPEAGWAFAVACLGVLMLTTAGTGTVTIGAGVASGSAEPGQFVALARAFTSLLLAAVGGCYGWTGFEGFRYYGMMGRRAALGLGDAVVANRFLLWGIVGVTSSAWNAVAFFYLFAGENIVQHPVPVTVRAIGGLLNSVLLVLIFMPPARYVRWLARANAS